MKKNLTRVAAVTAVALMGTAGAYAAKHEKIMLKDPAGNQLVSGSTTAFSIKTTCFGTVGCHGTVGATDNTKYSYDDIERHSYHAQLGANEFRGFNPANPDSPDAWRKGPGPKGKTWVQSPGHLGSW
jgi:hypothetical protein